MGTLSPLLHSSSWREYKDGGEGVPRGTNRSLGIDKHAQRPSTRLGRWENSESGREGSRIKGRELEAVRAQPKHEEELLQPSNEVCAPLWFTEILQGVTKSALV